MSNFQQQLELAQRHVQRGRELVAEHAARIAQATVAGHDVSHMDDLLETFKASLALFEDDLRWLSNKASRP